MDIKEESRFKDGDSNYNVTKITILTGQSFKKMVIVPTPKS